MYFCKSSKYTIVCYKMIYINKLIYVYLFTLQVQKKHYRKEKKRAAKELLSTLKDPSVIVMADWLKVRGSLKSWTKLWCVLKPGLFILYKSHKQKVSS